MYKTPYSIYIYQYDLCKNSNKRKNKIKIKKWYKLDRLDRLK